MPEITKPVKREFGRLDDLGDLLCCVLGWTPRSLLDEKYYEDDIKRLPQLPHTESEHLRPFSSFAVQSVNFNTKTPCRARRSTVVKFGFKTFTLLRPSDLVFLSTSRSPWKDLKAKAITGIVLSATRAADHCPPRVEIEVSTERWNTVAELKDRMYIVCMGSQASFLRVFDALCARGYSPLLSSHVLLATAPTERDLAQSSTGAHGKVVDRLISINQPLNDSQRTAVLKAMQPLSGLGKNLVLIQGPPGTGKTQTLSSMILAIHIQDPGQYIHVVAPSNAAVREIAVRLLRDMKKTNLLQNWEVTLFGNEESVDTADGIDDIYFEARLKRLRGFEDRWQDFKQKLRGFHDIRVTTPHVSSLYPTWEWRIETVTQGCELLRTMTVDLSADYVADRPSVTTCWNLLKTWRDKFRLPGTEFDDPYSSLINQAKALAGRIKLIRPLPDPSKVKGETKGPRKKGNLPKVIRNCIKVGFSTINSAASSMVVPLFKRHPLVILDEASQCIEPEIMILLHSEITGLVAIGDPQQLPSVVMNKTLERKGLGRSLFQRLIEGKSPYDMLSTQYRMCPSISQWPSGHFYGGKITNGPNVMLPARAPTWQTKGNILLCPYIYINVTGLEHRNDKTQSFSNPVECDVAYELVKELMRQAARISFSGLIEVGCVTGYTEQVKALKDKLCTLEGAVAVETGSRIERVLVKIAPLCQIGLDIASVDAFQGQERDMIIFCTTRANVGGGIGFLNDGRRLNVALTRARFALKILGNAATLASSPMWSDLAKDAKDRGCYLEGAALFPDLALPPASRSDPCKNKGSMKQDARFRELVDYDVEHSSKWRVVLTKSALSDVEGLVIDKQLALRNFLAAFAGGYNGAQQQKTDGIKGCPTFIKRFKFGDRFIIWTVLVVSKKPKLGVDITDANQATLYHYQQVICVWSISTEKSAKYMVRAIRTACEEFPPEYLTFCEQVEIRKKKALPVFFSTSRPLAPAL